MTIPFFAHTTFAIENCEIMIELKHFLIIVCTVIVVKSFCKVCFHLYQRQSDVKTL
jgi:hypothetical protein